MRSIDDLIDNYKAAHKVIPRKKETASRQNVNDWMEMIRINGQTNPLQKELTG